MTYALKLIFLLVSMNNFKHFLVLQFDEKFSFFWCTYVLDLMSSPKVLQYAHANVMSHMDSIVITC